MSYQYPLVSIIVPVWFDDEFGYQMTRRSLHSLLKTDYPNMEVIIVDDCSPYKKQQELVEEFAHDCIVILHEENEGSTGAVNTGILEAGGNFIQYQNNDTYFPNNLWLREQMKLFKDSDVGVVGCVMRYPNGTIQHAGACWRSENDHSIDHIGQHQTDIKYVEDVPFVTGCGMTVRREILDRNGGGFTEFKGYGWDDIDIQVKAKQWGWKVKVAPNAVFDHLSSYSYRMRPELASKENYQYNRTLFKDVPITHEETIAYFKKHYYID